MSQHPQPGTAAPDFTARAIGGGFDRPTELHLGSMAGRTVVLYFYPKDDTPGCTTQACALRDRWEEIEARTILLGVSPDSLESHRKFIAKHHLPFSILSDEGHRIAEAYGVWVEKKLYGKTYFGNERTTFVIGPDGLVRAILPKVKPNEHLGQLLQHVG